MTTQKTVTQRLQEKKIHCWNQGSDRPNPDRQIGQCALPGVTGNFCWGSPFDGKFTSNFKTNTLQGINTSHLGKRKIIFKMPLWGDMLVPWRVTSVCILRITTELTLALLGTLGCRTKPGPRTQKNTAPRASQGLRFRYTPSTEAWAPLAFGPSGVNQFLQRLSMAHQQKTTPEV